MLTLIIDYKGNNCESSITPEAAVDLSKLRDLLLRHRNEPMGAVVEMLEIDSVLSLRDRH